MAGVNQMVLIGNLVRDPEVRYTQAGDAVARFRIAVNTRGRSRDGKRADRVLFLDAEAWGGMADVVKAYTKKGTRVFLSGPLLLDEWKDKQGNRRSAYRLHVRQMQLLDRPGQSQPADAEDANADEEPDGEDGAADEDAPF